MKIIINTQNDHFLCTVDDWDVYITVSQEYHYLVQNNLAIIILGDAHNRAFMDDFAGGLLRSIRFLDEDNIEALSYSTSDGSVVIITNSVLDPVLERVLTKHSGNYSILTPDTMHHSGETPVAIEAHPSGLAISVIELD